MLTTDFLAELDKIIFPLHVNHIAQKILFFVMYRSENVETIFSMLLMKLVTLRANVSSILLWHPYEFLCACYGVSQFEERKCARDIAVGSALILAVPLIIFVICGSSTRIPCSGHSLLEYSAVVYICLP